MSGEYISTRFSKGFTLFELVIVLSILSIISTIGTISFLSFKQKVQLSGLANIIKSDLNRAKIIAARQKSYVVLQIQDNFYELFVDNGSGGATPGDWIRGGTEARIARREIAQTITLNSNFPGNHIRLRSSGRIRPGTFTIEDRSGRKIAVVVNAVGRVRLQNFS